MGTSLWAGAQVDPSSSQEAAAAEGQLRGLHLARGGLTDPALRLPSLPGDLQAVSQTQLFFPTWSHLQRCLLSVVSMSKQTEGLEVWELGKGLG